MRTNRKPEDNRFNRSERLAGGMGIASARQGEVALLRRAVLANLLWEDTFYENGVDNASHIKALVPLVDPEIVAQLAVEARYAQKLRHVPLFLARELARHEESRYIVGDLLEKIINRPDEMAEFLALYWKEGRCPLAKQVKVGLARAYNKFDIYQLAKWNRQDEVKLRDVMFLVHPKPANCQQGGPCVASINKRNYHRGTVQRDTIGQGKTWGELVEGTLPVPNTWEVRLSSGENKRKVWEDLISDGELGALAFIRNLRNMEDAGVDRDAIQYGFDHINPRWLLPVNYLTAAKHAPRWERQLEALMLRGLGTMPKLPGWSIFVVDVSGSMDSLISDKSESSRLDVAAIMAMLASEVCEQVTLYATAGSDRASRHQTEVLRPRHGFAVIDEVKTARTRLGGGGIFVRQCLEYIRDEEHFKVPDRIFIFSDSQDTDRVDRVPAPFGTHNYIIDVSSHRRGVNYQGLWDAEISGWSEHFLTYVAALEGLNWQQEE